MLTNTTVLTNLWVVLVCLWDWVYAVWFYCGTVESASSWWKANWQLTEHNTGDGWLSMWAGVDTQNKRVVTRCLVHNVHAKVLWRSALGRQLSAFSTWCKPVVFFKLARCYPIALGTWIQYHYPLYANGKFDGAGTWTNTMHAFLSILIVIILLFRV